MEQSHPPRTLVVLDSGCNNPKAPLKSGRIFHALSDGTRITPIIHGQSLPETVAVWKEIGKMFWTAMGLPGAADGALWTASLDGTDARIVIPPGDILNTPKQIVLDQVGQKVYVADREGMQIVACAVDGSSSQVLISTGDLSTPSHKIDSTRWCVGLAIDWEKRVLYWTQKGAPKSAQGRIFRANLDMPEGATADTRRDIEILMEKLPEPIDLEFDPGANTLYWTDRGDVPHGNSLNRCHVGKLTGKAPLVCEPLELTPYECLVRNLHDPIGLKLDPARRSIYVADMGGTVYSFDMHGGNKRRMYEDQEACYSGITFI